MLWAFASATLMGIVFGLFLRVPAVLAASVMIVASCIALMPIAHWSLLSDCRIHLWYAGRFSVWVSGWSVGSASVCSPKSSASRRMLNRRPA